MLPPKPVTPLTATGISPLAPSPTFCLRGKSTISPFRSEEHTSELQSHSDLTSFPTRRSSDLIAECLVLFKAGWNGEIGRYAALQHIDIAGCIDANAAPEAGHATDRHGDIPLSTLADLLFARKIDDLPLQIGRAHV